MIIPVGEYAPDLAPMGMGGLLEAKNVYPYGNGFKSLPALMAYSLQLDARCRGAMPAENSTGLYFNFAGDTAKLYQLDTSSPLTYADVSKAGGYNCSTDDAWEFGQWGDTVIATNYSDNIQVKTLIQGGAFADLAGSPPKAKHLSIVRDFVFLGYINDTVDGVVPHRVQWSGLNNAETWESSQATQADYQDLPDGHGEIMKVLTGEYAIIMQERSIQMATYAGTPLIFRFDKIADGIGTNSSGSVSQFGRAVYFWSYDGFYRLEGIDLVPIGANKVDKTFAADLDENHIGRISSAIDPINNLVLWAYPGSGNNGGNPNKMLIYNWKMDRWSNAEVDLELLTEFRSVGTNLDDMDQFGLLDDLPYSLDSKIWMGGSRVLGAFNLNHSLATFAGSTLSAVIDTGDSQLFPNRRAFIQTVLPLIEGGTATIQVGSREKLSDSVTFDTAVSQDDNGICNVRNTGRYHRFRINTSGDFDFVQGVDIEAMPEGKR